MTTLVDCPQSERGQWNFRLLGARVQVKVWFWVMMLFMVSSRSLDHALIWMAVCFVSVLLHEMGHVFAFRFFRRDADVVLYGFGGLAIPHGDVEGTLARVAVAFAGPLAGFCLTGLVIAAVFLTGGRIFFGVYRFLPHLSAMLNVQLMARLQNVSVYSYATALVNDLLFVNFYWGLINLLPVWPLDGGHISRAVLEQRNRFDGRRKSLIVSTAVAGTIALAGLANQDMFRAVMFGILAVSSMQAMQGESRRAISVYRRWRE